MDYIFWIIAIFVILDLFFVAYIYLFRRKRLSPAEKKKYLQYWNSVKNDKDNAQAIINADKLLDKLLTARGYTGSVGEKLKKANDLFGNVDAVWSAHKLRNKTAHEMGYKVSDKDTKSALQKFESAFRDLGLF